MWPFDNEEETQEPMVPPPAEGAMPVNPMVKDYLLNKFTPEARQKLVAENDADRAGPNWAAALGAFGAGLQGGNSAVAGQNILHSQEAARQRKLSDFDTGHETEMKNVAFNQQQDKLKRESDPNSPESKIAQDAVVKMGLDPALAKGMTAAKIKDMGPVFEKIYAVTANNQTRSDNAKTAAQARADRDADRALAQKGQQEQKDIKDLSTHLDKSWSGRSGQAGVIQGKINQAEAAEALIDQGRKQPGGLDSRQIEELAQTTSKLLSGSGASASARVEALVPHTWRGKSQSFKEWLSNEPKGAEMQAFTDRLADTIAREKETANNQKRQFQVEGLSGFGRLKKSNPDAYNDILASKGITPDMIDEKGRYKAPPKPKIEPSVVKIIAGKKYIPNPNGGWDPDVTQTAGN